MEQQNKYSVHNEIVLLQSVHHCPQDAFLRPCGFLQWNNRTNTVSTMRLFSFRASTTVRRMPFLDPVGSYHGTTKQIQCPQWGGSSSERPPLSAGCFFDPVGSYDGTTKQIQCPQWGCSPSERPPPSAGCLSSTLWVPTMEQQNKYSVHKEIVHLQRVHHRSQDAFLPPSRLLRWNNKTNTVSTMMLFSFRASTTVRRMPFFDPVGSYCGTTKQIQCPQWGCSPSERPPPSGCLSSTQSAPSMEQH